MQPEREADDASGGVDPSVGPGDTPTLMDTGEPVSLGNDTVEGVMDDAKMESAGEDQGSGKTSSGQASVDDLLMPEARPVAIPKGRASKKARKAKKGGSDDDDDEDESAYSESDESAYSDSDDSISSVESEEYESESDEDYSGDEEDYGRPQRGRGRPPIGARPYQPNLGPGYYNQWAAMPPHPGMMPMMMPIRPGMAPPMMPMMPMRAPMLAPRPLPPMVNPANVVRAVNPQGVRPALTPAQLQEIAKSTVASLLTTGAPAAGSGAAAEPKPEGAAEPAEGEKAPETAEGVPATQADAAKATVSDEIKQNLAKMLTDPATKQALMQRLYMNQIAKMQAAGQGMPQGMPQGQVPMMLPQGQLGYPMMRPMMSYPMMPQYPSMRPFRPMQQAAPAKKKSKEKRVRQPMKYDGQDADAPIAARRATRSAAKKVNFSRLYEEEEAVEAEIEQYAEEQASDDDDDSGFTKAQKIAARKMHLQDDLTDIKPEIRGAGGKKRGRKPKSRQASDEDSGDEPFLGDEEEYRVDDGVSSPTESDGEPTVSKILSHRVNADGSEEFYVKFTGLSYLHCDWIDKAEMLEAKMGATRINKFMGKPLSMHHYDDKNVFNPDYVQVDRILYGWDHPTLEDPKTTTSSYLVKWKGLPYEEATWEKLQTLSERIPNAQDKIAEWRARPSLESRLDPLQMKIGHRPLKSNWQAMPESPVYKSENTLRPYQLEGVNWLVYCWINKQSCIIADEMGLGKTVQSVAFIQLIKQQFRVPGPFLVVAPLSTIPHWEREFQAWTDMNVIVYHGSAASRDLMHEYEFYYKDAEDRVIPNVYRFDVLITTYEMAQAGFEALQPIIWRAGIFDEAHRLKNRGSKAAEVLSLFRLEHKIMLTGTPLQNNLEELFALLHFLQPQRFDSEEDFLEDYGNLQRSEDVQKLQELLRPLMLRRLKEDVEKSIPVKEETVIEVELTSLQKRYYRAILEKNFAFLTKGCRGNNAPNLVNTMMELRKCCIHPYLIKGSEDRILQECNAQTQDEVMQCMIQASGKLVLVDKLLKRLREQGHKVLIFSQMTRCLDLLADFLAYRGYPWERIDGAVKGEDRQAAIDRYCDPASDSFVFLLCTRAGGVGINLTVADTVVIYDSDWNPQNDLQAQARCHRIGQEKSVKVYRLITRNTYEREMFDKAGLKLGLDKAILQRMNNLEDSIAGSEGGVLAGTHGPQLSKKEVETLLKKGAYGVLMDGDDDSQRFCDEDIDQILSRRTQVIRHGAASEGPKETSLFSKATFAATADDYDIDLDDPNFWELWAKRLNMNPKDMLTGSGHALDEPRIRRQAKRLRSEDLLSVKFEYSGLDEEKPHSGDVKLWTVGERTELVNLLLSYGPNRMDKILGAFEGRRSRNDLVACIRALVKFCLAEGSVSDRNFREDGEKLLLANLDFDRSEERPAAVDEATGTVDLMAASEYDQPAGVDDESPAPAPPSGGKPYPNASKQQTAEFASFLKGAPTAWLDALRAVAYQAVLRMQLVDFLREVVESNGEASLPVPPLPGATPSEGWTRKDDQAILLAAYHHGYGAWFDLLEEEDPDKLAGKRNADLGELSQRLSKLVMAIVKRSQAAAKLAAHQASAAASMAGKTRRRRRVRGSDDEGSGSDDGEEDEEDEEFDAEEEPVKPARRSVPRKAAPPVLKALTVNWGRQDQQEFLRVVRSYGLPYRDLNGDLDADRDWSVFAQLGDFSPAITKSDVAFDEYCDLFVEACIAAANTRRRRRRRTKQEMAKARAEGEAGGDDDGEEEDDEGRLPGELLATDEDGADLNDSVNAPSKTAVPVLGPLRARALLENIDLLNYVRAPDFLRKNLESLLVRARRLSILPRWWKAGPHDAAILRGVAKYGFERDDLIIADRDLPFYSVFKDLGKIKASTGTTMSTGTTLPALVGEELTDRSEGDWPTLPNLITRVTKMYEMALNAREDVGGAEAADNVEGAGSTTNKSPVKRKRVTKEVEDSDAAAQSTTKKRKTSPKKAAKEPTAIEE